MDSLNTHPLATWTPLLALGPVSYVASSRGDHARSVNDVAPTGRQATIRSSWEQAVKMLETAMPLAVMEALWHTDQPPSVTVLSGTLIWARLACTMSPPPLLHTERGEWGCQKIVN